MNFDMMDTRRRDARQNKLAGLFFTLAIVFGLLFIFLEPPFVCPDENAHFINICRISRGGLFLDVQDGKPGSYVTEEEYDFLVQYGGYYNGQENTNRFDYQTMRELSKREPSDIKVFCQTHHAGINPTAYLVPSAVVALARFLIGPINAYNTLLFAKIANLFLYAFITRLAIRKTGAFANTMFLLALMPMALFQGASTSYDAILIPTAFLLFAYTTRLLLSYRALAMSEAVAVCFACACIFGVKIAYAPIILILLSIPIRRFGSWGRWFLCVGAVVAMGIVFYVLPSLAVSNIMQGPLSSPSALQLEQQAYFAENWTSFPNIIWSTVKHFGGYWAETFVGILGWLDTYFPTPFFALYIVAALFIALTDMSSVRGIRISTRVLSLLGVAAFFVGTLYVMYVQWNPDLVGIVGGSIAYGGQGRYFIPVALFVLIAFSNPMLKRIRSYEKLEEIRDGAVRLTALSAVSVSAVLLAVRYWM